MTTRRLALLGTAATLAGCAGRPSEDPRLAAAVEALVQPLVAARLFSGAVVLMRDGRPLTARGWGLANQEAGAAFTTATACDAASLAKNFTAAGIAALVHEGRLSWQQPAQALVPEYPHAGVTVLHLLAHAGGLAPDYTQFDRHFQPGQLRTTQALLVLAGRDQPRPRFEPGSAFEYSDLGFDAAALVIESASGQRYADFVRQRFFRPHGLVHGFARPARLADWPAPRTRGYRFAQGRWQDDDAYDGEAFLGASNLALSAQDLACWADAWAHARVLPPAADAAGQQALVLGGRASAINRLGWHGPHDGLSGHNTGNYNGFRAFVHWDRRQREAVAFVSNSALPQAEGDALQRALVGSLKSAPTTAP